MGDRIARDEAFGAGIEDVLPRWLVEEGMNTDAYGRPKSIPLEMPQSLDHRGSTRDDIIDQDGRMRSPGHKAFF